jgi:hypothetical protein
VSLRRQLRQLRQDLMDRAAREIHSRKSYFEDAQS